MSGEITRLLGPEAFVLNDAILVTYLRGPVPDRDPAVGQSVLVTGPFGRFARAAAEREVGRDLPDDTFAPFEGGPAIGGATIWPAR